MNVVSSAAAQEAPDLNSLQKQQHQLEVSLSNSTSIASNSGSPIGSALTTLQEQQKQLEAKLTVDSASSWWSVENAMTISSVVLIFGFVVLCLMTYLMRKEQDGHMVLRALSTVLILTFTVFLIVAGYSDKQIAPAIGLLGTIAGYLLGKDGSRERATKQNHEKPSENHGTL